MQREGTAPYGYCACGCGGKTNIAKRSDPRYGSRKGEPYRFLHGHGKLPIKQRWREEDRGHDTPCHIWLLAKTPGGYGQEFTRRGGFMQAHRRRYIEAHGDIPAGLQLDHLCGNRDCVNPAHLEPVTQTENVRRGRNAKLTLARAREIRARVASGETKYALAKHYGLSYTTIANVVRGTTWKEADSA